MNRKIRVLLVDDEKQFAINLGHILDARGFDTSLAFDGFEGVYSMKKAAFDVVILDIKMPGMDGVETLRELKKIAPNTEVIMLTGHATLESGIESLREGAYDYLMKPCEAEDLVEKIREAYEVETIKRHPVLWPRKLVRDMPRLPFIQLATGDTLSRALEIFIRRKGKKTKEELYVQDEGGRLEGVITKRDLVDEAKGACRDVAITWNDLIDHAEWLPKKKIHQVMKPYQLEAATPDEKLTHIADRMILNNVRCLPVVEGGKMTGIIKMTDIFQYVRHETE